MAVYTASLIALFDATVGAGFNGGIPANNSPVSTWKCVSGSLAPSNVSLNSNPGSGGGNNKPLYATNVQVAPASGGLTFNTSGSVDQRMDSAFTSWNNLNGASAVFVGRTISSSLDLLFVAKALERIGDHAKNIAELVIYIVKGEDVRHASIQQIETSLQQ